MEGTLEKIGLTKDEIQVYATIVQFGSRTIGQIQSYYKQPVDTIRGALNKLVGRGYIKEIKAKNEEGTPYFIPLPPQIKLTEDVSQRLENELKALSDDVKADWNKTMQNLRSQLASFHESVTQNVDSHATDVTSTAKQFLDSLSEVVSASKNEVTEIVGRVNSETSTLAESNSEVIAKAAQRVKENVLSSFDTTIHKIGEHHETFKIKIEESFSSLQQEHNDRTDVQLNAVLEKVEGIKESLAIQTQQFLKAVESRKNTIDTITHEAVEKLSTDSKTISQESSKKLSSTVNKIISYYNAKLDEYQEKVKEILTSLNEELKKLEEATTDRIRVSIDKSKETAVNILKKNENQFVELLNKTKVDSVEKLGELITQTEGKTEEMKNTLGDDLTAYLSDFKKNSDNLLGLLKKGIDNGFKLFEESLSSSIEKVSEQIKLFVSEIMSAFEESTNVIISDLTKTTNKYQKSLDSRINQFTSSNDEYNTNFTTHLKELKNSVVRNIEDNVKTNDESIKNLVSEKEEQFKNDVEIFTDDFSKRGRDIRDEVPNLVQINYQASLERLKELEDQFKQAIATMEEINSSFQGLDTKQLQRVFGKDEGPRMANQIGSMNRDIQLLKQNVGSKIEEMIQTFSSSMTNLSTEIFDKINTRLDDLVQFKDRTLLTMSQALENSRKELGNQFTNSLSDMKNKIADTYGTFEEQFNEIQSTSTKKLKEIVGTESEAFSNVTNSIKTSLEGLISAPETAGENLEEGEKTQMHLHIEEGLAALQASKEEILSLMTNNNKEVMSTLQETIRSSIDEHSQLVKTVISSMDGTMESLQSEFDAAKNALDTDVSVTLDEAAKNYSVQTSEVEDEINNLIEQEIQQFLESTEELMAELSVSPEKSSLLDEAVAHTKGELQKLLKDYPKWIKTDTDNFATKLESTVKEFQEKSQTEINNMYADVHKDLENTHERLAAEFNANVALIQEEFDKEKKDYELNITHQINSFITNSDANSSALVTSIQGTRDTLTEAITSGNETIGTDLNNLEKAINDLFSSYLNTLKEKLDKALQDSQVASTQREQYNSQIMSFKEKIIKGTQGEIESVDANITGILNAIPSKIDVVLAATGESMKLLKNVLSLGKGIEPSPIEDIWLVSGNEQVYGAMMSLLRQTKSSATVISPLLHWIDAEFLDEFGRKLEIVTNTGVHSDADKVILNKLLSMGNVTVKDDPQLTVMLGTRDGIEEGFLGHITPSGEPVLIITFNEEMVREITKIYYEFRSRAPMRAS
jgi:sugar-specific transcriptional regulator TrmB